MTADHIDIYGDKAWWVVPADQLAASTALIDRPCDTCGGHGRRKIGNHLRDEHCPDCDGTGRHTFEVEVGQPKCPPDCIAVGHIRTLRVSVVPDMVLPIVDETDILNGVEVPARHIILRYTGEAWLVSGTGPIQRITLPPAAKPGMWAVRHSTVLRWSVPLETHGST